MLKHIKNMIYNHTWVYLSFQTTALGWRTKRLDQRPLRIRHITRIPKPFPIVMLATLRRPHSPPPAVHPPMESQAIPMTQHFSGRPLSRLRKMGSSWGVPLGRFRKNPLLRAYFPRFCGFCGVFALQTGVDAPRFRPLGGLRARSWRDRDQA